MSPSLNEEDNRRTKDYKSHRAIVQNVMEIYEDIDIRVTPTKHAIFIAPSQFPTSSPSTLHSFIPSLLFTSFPSQFSSELPTLSFLPSQLPSTKPSHAPSLYPSDKPSVASSKIPTSVPTKFPSSYPTSTSLPSSLPSKYPTTYPSMAPSEWPSFLPSIEPTLFPSLFLSSLPSVTSNPSLLSSTFPSILSSSTPTTNNLLKKASDQTVTAVMQGTVDGTKSSDISHVSLAAVAGIGITTILIVVLVIVLRKKEFIRERISHWKNDNEKEKPMAMRSNNSELVSSHTGDSDAQNFEDCFGYGTVNDRVGIILHETDDMETILLHNSED